MSPEDAAAASLDALAPGTTVVLAVSGGADSIALLHLLARSPARGRNEPALVAAHLDHGLRGRASAEDARFVREVARTLEIPVRIGRARLGTDAAEARARRVRYRFLLDTARRFGAGPVFTAHTLEDQAETVLDRLLRGTGIRGLRGILPDRRLSADGAIRVCRPLLEVRREDLRSWLGEHDLPWREDSTNHDGSNRRSRLRRELMPHIEGLGPGGVAALSRVARRAAEAWDLVSRETRRRERMADRRGESAANLSRDALRAAPIAVRWPLLSRWLVRNGQEPRGLGEVAIREALRIALHAPSGTRFERPARVAFEVSRRHLRCRRRP